MKDKIWITNPARAQVAEITCNDARQTTDGTFGEESIIWKIDKKCLPVEYFTIYS